MTVSEITSNIVAQYLRLDTPSQSDLANLNNILTAAKVFVSDYTGIPIISTTEDGDDFDNHDDIVPVVLILCQDMYDNRSLYVEKSNMNRLVTTILDMHSVNLV